MAESKRRDPSNSLLLLMVVQLSMMVGLSGALTEPCSFHYITHPPPEVPCNPYNTDLGLRIECTVSGPYRGAADVTWFFAANGTGQSAELNQTQDITIFPSKSGNTMRSQLRISLDQDTRFVGDYWCQIRADDNSLELSQSIVTSFKPPKYYLELPNCPHFYFHYSQLTCAENRTSTETGTDPQPSPSPPSATGLPHGGCSVVVTMATGSAAGNQSENTDGDGSSSFLLAGVMLTAVGVPLLVAIVILIVMVAVIACKRHRGQDLNERGKDSELVAMVTSTSSEEEQAGNSRRINRSQSLPPHPHHIIARQNSTDSSYEAMPPGSDHQARSLINRLKVACGAAPTLPPHPQTANGEVGGALGTGAEEEDGPSLEYAEPEARPSAHDRGTVARDENEIGYANDDQPRPLYQGLDPNTQEYMDLYVTPGNQGEESQSVEVDNHQYQLPTSSSMEPINLYTVPATDQEHYYY